MIELAKCELHYVLSTSIMEAAKLISIGRTIRYGWSARGFTEAVIKCLINRSNEYYDSCAPEILMMLKDLYLRKFLHDVVIHVLII